MFIQLATAVVMSLGLFIFVLVTGNVLRRVVGELVNGRISIPMLFEIVGLICVSVIPYAMPLGMLTGVLLILGRMSSSNEILAMKAAGMNLWRIVSPIFFIAFIGVCVSAYINCFWAPSATNKYRTILKSTFRDAPTKLIVPGTLFTEFPGYSIYAESREGDELKNFWIWELDEASRPIRTTHAEKASIRFVEAQEIDDEDSLFIDLTNPITEERSRKHPEKIVDEHFRFSNAEHFKTKKGDKYVRGISIPLGKILSKDVVSKKKRKLRWFTLPELFELREEGWRCDPKTVSPEELFTERVQIQFQMQNYLTSAVACFSLAILGIPLGIRVSRSETFVNIGIALALALTFYMLTTFISWLEDHPSLRPDILVWIPNILYQVVGFILLRKAAKN